jgi:hypothetical protein
VTLSADRLRYRVGDEVLFTRTVTNRGQADLSLHPFAYLNGHVRFYWINADSLTTRRYGDGKCGVARPQVVRPGRSATERLTDNAVTQQPGTYLVFVSSELVGGARLESNVLRIEVVPADAPRPAGRPGNLRFLDRGDHVEDSRSGLLWQKDGAASGKRDYYAAAKYAAGLNLGGLAGWRVPTREELAGIFPATEPPFRNTKYTDHECCQGPHEYNSYWTSELDLRLPDYAYVYQWYGKGGANNGSASGNLVYVRCVHDALKGK